jgi:UDP-3-O-[3-hydroxymyristoyl] glucosamine N-acyltransferase
MLLSKIVELAAGEVWRDGDFENLGFISDCASRTFTFVEHARFLATLRRNKQLCAVLTKPDLASCVPEHLKLAVCEQPRVGFALIHNHLASNGFYWKDFASVIEPQTEIHETAWIAKKSVRIGAKSVVGPNATILERCVIGECCVLGAGSVSGGVGFQTVRTPTGLLEMRHAGGLVLGDGIHVLPGAVLATGLFRQNTEIASDVRIGSQAFISHGVRIGRGSFVGHGAVLNGNVTVGDDVWIGPGAVVSQTLEIGDHAVVTLGAVVIRDVPPRSRVSGNFAIGHRALLRNIAAMESDD